MIDATVCIGAVMKGEQPYIVEWVAWHRWLGFDVIIADNGGDDGQTELLLTLEALGEITRIDVRHITRAPQRPAYYAIFRHARRAGVRHLGFLDADEFFEPLPPPVRPGAGAATVRALFDAARTEIVAFNWMCFGSSSLREASSEPVMRRFTRSAPPDFDANRHFKSFGDVARLHARFGSGTFGRLRLHGHGFDVGAAHQALDGAPMTFAPELGFGVSDRVSWRHARIRHYVVKSIGEYWSRKVARGHVGFGTYPDWFLEAHDRNDCDTPFDADALVALEAAIRALEARLAATPAGDPRPRLARTIATTWQARPTAGLLLKRLGRALGR